VNDSDPAQFDAITIEQMREKEGVKWNRYPSDVLPCFVADMDFSIPQTITDALRVQLDRGDYGYTRRLGERELPHIYSAWAKRRHGWDVDPDSVVGLVDIVQGIYITAQMFAEPGDGIITLTPTYPPLWRSVEETGRRLLACTMQRGPERYEIDFDRLDEIVDKRTRILLLCNPHNPTGRVFTRGELEALASFAIKHDLTVLSDEIHCDLVFAPHKHIPFASLGPEIAKRTITMTSATKSFNLAGLRFAIAVFGSPQLRERFDKVPERVRGGLNSLGVLATEVAWRDCESWLDSLIGYLRGNRDFLVSQIHQRIPGMEMRLPESTFLSWLDCAQLPINGSPFEHYLQVGKIGMNDGEDFGDGGAEHVRLNFATSRTILTEIVDRLARATP
jgi:cystathionine beta-lyase